MKAHQKVVRKRVASLKTFKASEMLIFQAFWMQIQSSRRRSEAGNRINILCKIEECSKKLDFFRFFQEIEKCKKTKAVKIQKYLQVLGWIKRPKLSAQANKLPKWKAAPDVDRLFTNNPDEEGEHADQKVVKELKNGQLHFGQYELWRKGEDVLKYSDQANGRFQGSQREPYQADGQYRAPNWVKQV